MVTGVLRARIDIDPLVMRLINGTIAALDAAGLDDAIVAVLTRLIDRPAKLIVIRKVGDGKLGAMRAELEPFAELLFYELRDIARRNGDSATKTRWIDQALSLGGV